MYLFVLLDILMIFFLWQIFYPEISCDIYIYPILDNEESYWVYIRIKFTSELSGLPDKGIDDSSLPAKKLDHFSSYKKATEPPRCLIIFRDVINVKHKIQTVYLCKFCLFYYMFRSNHCVSYPEGWKTNNYRHYFAVWYISGKENWGEDSFKQRINFVYICHYIFMCFLTSKHKIYFGKCFTPVNILRA